MINPPNFSDTSSPSPERPHKRARISYERQEGRDIFKSLSTKNQEFIYKLADFFETKCSELFAKLAAKRGKLLAVGDALEMSTEIVGTFKELSKTGVVSYFSKKENFPIRILFGEKSAKGFIINDENREYWLIRIKKLTSDSTNGSSYDSYDVRTGKVCSYTKFKHLSYASRDLNPPQKATRPIRFCPKAYFDQVHSEDEIIQHYQFEVDRSSISNFQTTNEEIKKIAIDLLVSNNFRHFKSHFGQKKSCNIQLHLAAAIATSFFPCRADQIISHLNIQQSSWENFLYRLMHSSKEYKRRFYTTSTYQWFFNDNPDIVKYQCVEGHIKSLANSLLSKVKKINSKWNDEVLSEQNFNDLAATTANAFYEQECKVDPISRFSKWNNYLLSILFGTKHIKGLTLRQDTETSPVHILRLQPIGCGAQNKLYFAMTIIDNTKLIYRKPRKKVAGRRSNMHGKIQEAGIPHIVRLHHHTTFSNKSGQLTFREIITYCNRRSLHSHIHNIDSEQKLEITKQLANFLREMHRKSFYHGDLSAHNVFLKEKKGKFSVHVGDFDLSGFKTFPPGQLVGDGRYSAPDYWLIDFAQLQPSKGDLWSLGILMYELKYYGKVFNLQGEDLSKTSTSNIQSKYEEFIASIQEIADRSNPLDALFLDLIQIDPDKRPSAAEVVERITNLKPDHFMPCFEVNCEPVLKQMNNEYEMSPSVTASDASLVREEQPIHSTKQQSNLKIMGQNGYYTFQ